MKHSLKIFTATALIGFLSAFVLLMSPQKALAATCYYDPDFHDAGSVTSPNLRPDECESQPVYNFAPDPNPSFTDPVIIYKKTSLQGSSLILATLHLLDKGADPLTWRGDVGDPQNGYPNHIMIIAINRSDFTNGVSGIPGTRNDNNGQSTKQISVPLNDIMTQFAQANGIAIANAQTGGSGCTSTGQGICAPSDPCAQTNSSSCAATDIISNWINPALTFLSIGFGVLAAIMIVIGGIQYSASAGDPQAAAAAKNRIMNVAIAIIAYFLIFALLKFIIPGSKF